MIKRYARGVHLRVPECKYAYAKGRYVIVERNKMPDLRFGLASAILADQLATEINKDLDASFVDVGGASDTVPTDPDGDSGTTQRLDDVRLDDEGECLHQD